MKSVILRVGAVFGYSSLAAVAGGAIVDVELWKAAFIAGAVAASNVVSGVLKAYADDGKVTKAELDEIFGAKKGK